MMHYPSDASENKAIIGSDNGWSPVPNLDSIWTNTGILLARPLARIPVKFESKYNNFH